VLYSADYTQKTLTKEALPSADYTQMLVRDIYVSPLSLLLDTNKIPQQSSKEPVFNNTNNERPLLTRTEF
jgi:hypothetical protein